MTDEPLRIVHVIARLNVGGAALQVLELAAGLRRRGHEVLVLHGALAEGEESMAYVAEERGIPHRYLPMLQRELSPPRDWAAVNAIRRSIRSERPDVLHTHAAKAGATGRLAAVAARRPAVRVHTFHGHVLRGYFAPHAERAFTLAERALGRTTGALIAPSPEVRDELVGLGVARAARFEVIPYGFDFPEPSNGAARERVRRDLGIAEGTFVAGFAGRLTAIKRPLDLVRALAELKQDAVLVLVGDGPDRAEAEALAAKLGVAERCRFVGYRTALEDWYAAFDAFVLASANEGTPVAAIEALAAGRPVVATRVGGTPTVVDDGETGFLVEPARPDQLADRLAELARQPERREQMGRCGAERMRERFGIDRMVDEHERLYMRLLAR